MDYKRGILPIEGRIKKLRPEIKDNMVVEITEFKQGYGWGPILYVQRTNKEIWENKKDAGNVGIAMLNEMTELQML